MLNQFPPPLVEMTCLIADEIEAPLQRLQHIGPESLPKVRRVTRAVSIFPDPIIVIDEQVLFG